MVFGLARSPLAVFEVIAYQDALPHWVNGAAEAESDKAGAETSRASVSAAGDSKRFMSGAFNKDILGLSSSLKSNLVKKMGPLTLTDPFDF